MDENGNMFEDYSGGIGSFGPFKDKKKEADGRISKEALKSDQQALEAFGQAVQRNVADGMELQDAMSNARNQIDYASEGLKQYAMNSEVLDEKQGKLKIDTDDYAESLKKTQERQKEVQKGQKGVKKFWAGLSSGSKALLGNLGVGFGVGVALEYIPKLIQWFNEADDRKINDMNEAVDKYNSTISETSKNTQTIQSLGDEFHSLSKGVDENGKNIGLSADQYERYNQIVRQLADINPSIVKGYTAEGNAIVDRNKAISDSIKLQEEAAAKATKEYTSSSTGNEIIEGANADARKKLKETRNSLVEVGEAFNDLGGLTTAGPSTGQGAKSSSILTDYLGREVDLTKASVADLEKIVGERDKILADAKESGKYTDDELKAGKEALNTVASDFATYEEAYTPIYQWLSTAMAQIDEETGRAITDNVPEALKNSYEQGLKQISASSDLTAGQMKVQGENLADSISEAYANNTDNLATILNNAKAAKDAFLDSDKGDGAVETANDALKTQAEALDDLADKYADTDAALSTFYQNEANAMRDFVANNELSIKNAFGAFDDLISSARNSKAEFDAAMSDGDYYTGIDNYKSIYDTIFDGKNNLGKGSMAFWQGAEQILGTEALRKAEYNIDAIQAKLKKWKPMLKGGAEGAALFGKELLKIGDGEGNIKDDLGNIIGEVKKTSDGIDFEIPREHISQVAEQLGVSTEMLTAMIDSARQFSNVDFHNVEDVAKAAKQMADDNDRAVRGKDEETVFLDSGMLEKESGKTGKELQELKNNLKEYRVEVITAGSKTSTLKEQLGKLGTLTGKKLDTQSTVGYFNAMGMSADDAAKIIDQLRADGIEVDLGDAESAFDYVTQRYQKLKEDTKNEVVVRVRTQMQGATQIKDSLNGIEELTPEQKSEIVGARLEFEKTGDLEAYAEVINELPDDVRTQVLIATEGKEDAEEVSELLDDIDKEKEHKFKIKTEKSDVDDLIEDINEGNIDNDVEYEIDIKVKQRGLGLKRTLKEIGLEEEDVDLVVDAVVELEETGDFNTFAAKINELPPKKQVAVLTSIFGEDKAITLKSLIDNVNSKDVMVKADVSGTEKVSGLSALWSTIKSKTATITTNVKKVFTTSWGDMKEALGFDQQAEGTPNRRKQSHFPSMAKGGKLGPHGKGGLTLTGELGAELVWSPSESRSFLVGQYGPEMVDLPSDAVVYPADETRRIIGDSIPRNRFNFGSLAAGTEFGSMASAGGSIKIPGRGGSSSSNRGSSSSSSSKRSSSKNSSKKSSDKAKESAYERARKALDHELEMGYMSEATYYTKLNALYNKHKKSLAKNVDDKRDALEDLRKAWIDAYEAAKDSLDHQLEMGTLSEEQYYNKLKALGDKYYKNRKGYTNEWKAHLEELKDARKDVYDAQLEDLDKSLENEKITVEKYFKEVSKLQGKWLSGKEMAKDREEALEDMFDQMLDAIENEYDDVQQLIDDKDLFKAWKEGETPEQLLSDFKQQVIKYYNAGMIQANDYKELMMEIEREIQEAKNDGYEEEKDQLDEIMDLVEDLVRQETEDMIDALEDQIDAYSELIDKKKEALQMAEDEMAYMDEMTDLATQISEKQAEIAVLSRDDSRAGQAKLAEAQKELAELLKEQNQTVREETLNKTEDALDEQGEKFEEALEGEIEKLEDFLDNQSAVLEEVLKQLENRDTNKLYDRLMEYNSKYGDGMIKTVTDFWEDLSGLTKKYGNDLEKIVEILQKGTDDGKTGGLIPVHHKGLAAGFTGDGADLKQHEVYRLLTDDELVLNREDQMRLAGQLGVIDAISNSYGKLARSITPKVSGVPSSIEISVNSPINIKGSATPEVVDELNKFGDKLANNTLDKLNEALRMNGVRTRAASNIRKN